MLTERLSHHLWFIRYLISCLESNASIIIFNILIVSYLSFFVIPTAALDIILSWKAWGSMEYTQIIRYLLKFSVAVAWVIILLVSYSGWVENPSGPIRYFSNWIGNWRSQSLYSFAIAIYLIPNILAAVLFLLPPLRRFIERSNWRVIVLLMWWAQVPFERFLF
jgi:callose synthase